MYYGHCCIYIFTSDEEGQPESDHIHMIHHQSIVSVRTIETRPAVPVARGQRVPSNIYN